MLSIRPFRAVRYDPTLVPDLSAVTAPPYDVIDAELHQQLLANPYNIVHLDLNPATTDINEPDNRYRRAAQLLGEWRDRGVLKRDSTPALYVYEQEYEWAGATLRRRSVIACVRLDGDFRSHEKTFSAPKEDRFRLTVETRCNVSQILGIYDDPEGAVFRPLEPLCEEPPAMTAVGIDGDRNRVWIQTDPAVIAAVSEAIADKAVYIADGHHRFETARRYLEWLTRSESLDDDHPAQYTTAALVGSSDPGLLTGPTHRVVRGLGGFDLAQLRALAAGEFEWCDPGVDPHDGDAIEAWLESVPLSAVAVLTADTLGLLTPRDPHLAAEALPDASPALRELNVCYLHHIILPRYVAPTWGEGSFDYVHRGREAVAQVAAGADTAFLLRATPLETMLEIAGGGELMPHKTTYFYPKLLTGLVLYPLRG